MLEKSHSQINFRFNADYSLEHVLFKFPAIESNSNTFDVDMEYKTVMITVQGLEALDEYYRNKGQDNFEDFIDFIEFLKDLGYEDLITSIKEIESRNNERGPF